MEVFNFLFHQQTGNSWAGLGLDCLGNSVHAGMLTVTGAEGVVDVCVAQLGQLCSEGQHLVDILAIFTRIKPNVLQHEYIAGCQFVGYSFSFVACDIGRA